MLEILTMFDHFCDIRASSCRLINVNMKSTLILNISLCHCFSAEHYSKSLTSAMGQAGGTPGRGSCSVPRMRADKTELFCLSVSYFAISIRSLLGNQNT